MSENDAEQLLAGRAPAGHTGLREVAVFVQALGAAAPQATADPDPALIARLAEAAGASESTSVPALARRPRRRRAALVARGGIAVAMVPVLFAGLAVAGVTLPGPAQDAFDSVGIELPNQASDDSAGKGGAESDDEATDSDDQQGSNGKASPRSKRKAYGPSRSARENPPGEAVRRGPNPTPGTPRGKPDTLPSSGSNAGGRGAENSDGQSTSSNAGGSAGAKGANSE